MEVFFGVMAAGCCLALIVAVWQRSAVGSTVDKLRKDLRDLQVNANEPPLLAPVCHHEWGVLKEEALENEREKKTITILQCKFCGNLDKTVESIRVPDPPKPAEPRSECRHSWELQKSIELESAYEQMKDNSESCESFQPWMFRKTVIIQRICTRCGEISTVESSNYDLKDLPENSTETTPYRKPRGGYR